MAGEPTPSSGDDGNDLAFGDHGSVTGVVDLALLPLSMALAAHPFAWTSIDTGAGANGGSDLIRGNAGDDVLIGGQGGDRIIGGAGDDDLIGGHNVAGGSDGGDALDGGAGNDWLAGDNADLLRTGDRLSPRFRVLAGAQMYAPTAPRSSPPPGSATRTPPTRSARYGSSTTPRRRPRGPRAPTTWPVAPMTT